MAGWFSRFPARTQTYEDIYLLDTPLPGLSVKIRSGQAFEVKAYRGSRGILEVTGRARGALQSWQERSFPRPAQHRGSLPGGWTQVVKTRQVSHFGLADGQAVSGDPPAGAAGLLGGDARGVRSGSLCRELTVTPGQPIHRLTCVQAG